MIENLYWGKEFQLGYAKHPPLFAWISYAFYKMCFSIPESLYILTQLNLLVGLYFIYKISEIIFSEQTKRWASVLIFMCSVCAVFGNEKFNASTILMSLFPAMFYYFTRMMKYKKTGDAIILGIVAALAFIGKYFALLYIGCAGFFVLWNDDARKLLETRLPYVAVVTFLIGISWNLHWLYQNDFVTVKYALEKSIKAKKSYASSINFLAMQFIFFSTSFWAFAYAYEGKMKFLPQKIEEYSCEEKFIMFMTIAPNVLMFLASLLFGMRIGSFWGTNMLMTVGIYLLLINKEKLDLQKLFIFTKRILVFFGIVLFLKLGVARLFLREYDPRNALNIRKIAHCIENDWHGKFGNQKIRYIKTDKATTALHTYLKDDPSFYDVVHNDIFHVFERYPLGKNVVVAFLANKNNGEVEKFRKIYDGCILFENSLPLVGDYIVYYAFIRDQRDGGSDDNKTPQNYY